MSFDRKPRNSNDFGVSKPSKPRLRSVRLELPQNEFPTQFSPNSNQHFSLPSNQVFRNTGINYQVSSPQVSIPSPNGPPVMGSIANGATLVTASIFHFFAENSEPSFVCDIMTPNNAMPFTTQPPANLTNPRFFLYSVSVNPVPQAPIKLIVNGKVIRHFNTDHQPLDITDILLPFGQQNWLIIESGNIVVPFSVVGIWVSFLSMEDIIQEIESKGNFVLSGVAAPCPITGAPIEIPARGCQCNHEQNFDLVPYITLCQATSRWICPICRQPVGLEELRIGTANQMLNEHNIEGQSGSPGIVWTEQPTPFFEDNDAFWSL